MDARRLPAHTLAAGRSDSPGNTDVMAEDVLLPFVRRAKELAVADDSIVGILRQNGWPERRIFRALSEYYAATLGLAIPTRTQSTENARDAFLYLLNFIALGFWMVALWQIWDDLVRRWFPDALSTRPGTTLREDMAWQLAFVIIGFPLFVFVHSTIQRELARRPELYFSSIRRWLTYVALVLAAVVVIIAAAGVIQALIVGQLTTHFLLDALLLLILAGGVFAYYLVTIEPPKQRQ